MIEGAEKKKKIEARSRPGDKQPEETALGQNAETGKRVGRKRMARDEQAGKH